MAFRLVKVSGFYDGFLRDYYRRYAGIVREPYHRQYEHLMAQGFGWADYLCRHLNEHGVEAHEIVGNAESLNHAWARENGLRAAGTAELILERIRRLAPDVVFLQDTGRFTQEWCRRLRDSAPSVRRLVGWRCSPFSEPEAERFRAFDLMISCTPAVVEDLRARGAKAALLYHGFEDSLVPLLDDAQASPRARSTDVLFAGSLIQAKDYHYGRIDFLNELVRRGLPLKIHAEMAPRAKLFAKRALGAVSSALERLGFGNAIERSPQFSRTLQWRDVRINEGGEGPLRQIRDEPLYGIDLYRLMRRAKVSLNFHIDFAGDYAGNARLFEATGAGSCLLTDHKRNLVELFEPDSEVVTFKSAAECAEKARWLLDHPDKRREIAEAGRKRCLKDHSLRKRAGELQKIVSSIL